MDAKDFARQALGEKGTVSQVYWVACGGSVIDLYPAHCLVNATSKSIVSGIYTAAEFNAFAPAQLGAHSVVVTCSHSGGTPETIAATRLAKERGAYVLAMTNRAGSKIDNGEWPCWVYEWEDDTPQAARPAGFSLAFAAELMAAQDGYDGGEALARGLAQLDAIIAAAKPRVAADLGPRFVELCRQHDFLYVLGSGPTFCQTYGFAICSLMEMQWQN
ncbi:SIS domain-containing protein, partial [Parafannyhessea umbonata]